MSVSYSHQSYSVWYREKFSRPCWNLLTDCYCHYMLWFVFSGVLYMIFIIYYPVPINRVSAQWRISMWIRFTFFNLPAWHMLWLFQVPNSVIFQLFYTEGFLDGEWRGPEVWLWLFSHAGSWLPRSMIGMLLLTVRATRLYYGW